MLQRPHPPTQFFKVGFAVLVGQRVDDVFNLRDSLAAAIQTSRNHDGRLSDDPRPSKLLTGFDLIAQLADGDDFGALPKAAESGRFRRNRIDRVAQVRQ